MAETLIWWRRWLRMGPSRAALAAEAQLWQERCGRKDVEKREAYARAKAAERKVRETEARMREVVALVLTEPDQVDGCHKVRFHRRPEAQDWAAAIGTKTGEGAEVYDTYQCKVCPLSPVTMKRYWHARHKPGRRAASAKEAGRRRRARQFLTARDEGRLIDQLVDEETADRLRQMGSQEGRQS